MAPLWLCNYPVIWVAHCTKFSFYEDIPHTYSRILKMLISMLRNREEVFSAELVVILYVMDK